MYESRGIQILEYQKITSTVLPLNNTIIITANMETERNRKLLAYFNSDIYEISP